MYEHIFIYQLYFDFFNKTNDKIENDKKIT